MRTLTTSEQECLSEVTLLNKEIFKLHERVHQKLDELLGITSGLSDVLSIADINFWISVLPPGFHRSELRVLLNKKMRA